MVDPDLAPFHAGFDLEAFSFDFLGAGVRLLRLGSDGIEVQAPTEVGSIASIEDDSSSFRTDPETGITWLGTDTSDGVWLSGHLRDGSPLPWTGPEQGRHVMPQGVSPISLRAQNTALAADGERALVAWGTNTLSTTYVQVIDQGEETGNALVLFDNPQGSGPYLWRKDLARFDQGWWLGAIISGHDLNPIEMGVHSFWLGDTPSGSVELTGRSALVGWPPCWPACEKDMLQGFNLRYPAALRYQDELWYGFEDGTNTTPPIYSAYRIVRVGRSCRYPTLFEIYHPELMPAEP
jgi:hypothetical protein